MFGAIGRWFKAVGYLLTGQIDSARRTLDSNPHVMGARYDDVVKEKTKQIHRYKEAVGALVAQQENKLQKIQGLTEEVTKLERLKSGALAKAKKRIESLQASGMSKEQFLDDEEYQMCQNAFQDFSSSLTEKQAHIEEIEGDVKNNDKNISDHKVQLTDLLRDVEKIRDEKVDAVADVISAKEEKEIAETIAGIAKDGTSEELQRMRQLRQELKAEAKVTKELAGTDSRAQEAEFMEYARQDQGNSEFEALLGLAADTDSSAPAAESDTGESTLPE